MEPAIDDCMTNKECSFEPIRQLEIEIHKKRQAWLTNYGWEYRCDFIDAGWRWVKEIEGKLMMCDEGEAINIEYNYLVEEAPAATERE